MINKDYGKVDAQQWMNRAGRDNRPFLFAVNYACTDCRVWPLDEVPDDTVLYKIGAETNATRLTDMPLPQDLALTFTAERPDDYHKRFNIVKDNLYLGNSFLVNLTNRIPIQTSMSLKEIFTISEAKYKLLLKDKLVCFSPETFLQINDGIISCCPMKGTIKADSTDSLQHLIDDRKEAAEHATIVDLIRNDLSIVADHVHVERYRYADLLHTDRGDLWQTSSRITGQLPEDYRSHIGDILFSQLPAGSITGAPKPKTMEIIHQAEPFDRGFYTGVMGLYKDGNLDSAVMIRFIDKENGQLYFKAGGGITARSDWNKEYEEVIEKIYVPIHRDDKN